MASDIPRVGFAHIDAQRYHSDPCAELSLSASIAKTLATRCELLAWHEHPRLGGRPRKPTPEMELGTLIHELVLGDGRGFVLVVADDWRTNAAKAAREAARAEGKVAILEHKLTAAREAALSITAQLQAHGVFFGGESEVAMFWEETADDGTVVRCRALADHVIVNAGIIYDLKSCESANPEKLPSRVYEYGYDIQRAAYVSALEKIRPELAGRVQYELLFAESSAPNVVCPAPFAGSMIELGHIRWRKAINKWAACMNAGLEVEHWPGYPRTRLEARPYMLDAELQADVVAEEQAA